MIVNNPKEYIKKNAGIWGMYGAIIFVYTLLVLLTYNLYFIRNHYATKETVAKDMKETIDEVFKDGKYYAPEEVKLIPIMTKSVSTSLDKDIIKTLITKCQNVELTMIIKTVDPLLLERTDVSFEVESTGKDYKDCNFNITAQDKIK